MEQQVETRIKHVDILRRNFGIPQLVLFITSEKMQREIIRNVPFAVSKREELVRPNFT